MTGDQDGTRRALRNSGADTPEQKAIECIEAARPHHDQIDPQFAGTLADDIGRETSVKFGRAGFDARRERPRPCQQSLTFLLGRRRESPRLDTAHRVVRDERRCNVQDREARTAEPGERRRLNGSDFGTL
jgi:hypothetical protein